MRSALNPHQGKISSSIDEFRDQGFGIYAQSLKRFSSIPVYHIRHIRSVWQGDHWGRVVPGVRYSIPTDAAYFIAWWSWSSCILVKFSSTMVLIVHGCVTTFLLLGSLTSPLPLGSCSLMM